MFATLDLKTGESPRANKPGGLGKPKRAQVRFACDWCKLMRIKCDNDRPCSNCQQSGRQCGVGRQTQFRSLAAAVKEVESLRGRLEEFETVKKQLEALKSGSVSGSDAGTGEGSVAALTPSTNSLSPPEPQPTPAFTPAAEGPSSSSSASCDAPSPAAVGMPMPAGVVSASLFVTRLRRFLDKSRPHLPAREGFTLGLGLRTALPAPMTTIEPTSAGYLLPNQELHFLALFWQSHYFSYPILSESQFARDYQALIAHAGPGQPRAPSPLVDIMVALCMQIANFAISSNSNSGISVPAGFPSQPAATARPAHSYASLAGFQYYRRCQDAIDQTAETPSLTTVRCYIFSIVYLYEAGLVNTALVMAGKAVMTAILLGLHQEPPAHLPAPEREMARRTWWSLHALDTRLSAEAGPSSLASIVAGATCNPPTDSDEYASWLAPHYHHDDTCPPWLGFQTQTLRLLDVAGLVRSARDARLARVVGKMPMDGVGAGDPDEAFVRDSAVREDGARCLAENMKALQEWARQVPKGYYLPRRDGDPFSIERSILDLALSPNILIHCQRQRILLELHYHHLCTTLYQPFICFSTASDGSTPVADGNATAGLYHAMAFTDMMHQVLATTGALNGVYHVFRWQVTALLTLVGYAYAFPLSYARDRIRVSIDKAVVVLDMYRDVLPDAAAVVSTAHALQLDVNAVIDGFYAGSLWPPPSASMFCSPSAAVTMPSLVSYPSVSTNESSSSADTQPLPITTPSMGPADPTFNANPMDLDSFAMALGDGDADWDMMETLWANVDSSAVNASFPDSWALPDPNPTEVPVSDITPGTVAKPP